MDRQVQMSKFMGHAQSPNGLDAIIVGCQIGNNDAHWCIGIVHSTGQIHTFGPSDIARRDHCRRSPPSASPGPGPLADTETCGFCEWREKKMVVKLHVSDANGKKSGQSFCVNLSCVSARVQWKGGLTLEQFDFVVRAADNLSRGRSAPTLKNRSINFQLCWRPLMPRSPHNENEGQPMANETALVLSIKKNGKIKISSIGNTVSGNCLIPLGGAHHFVHFLCV